MMRVLLIASGYTPELGLINDRYPSPMIPCLDRPFIQHIIEYLSQQHFEHFDILLCHHPEKIERILGDGTRWGVDIQYHLIRDPHQPYKLFKIMDLESGNEPFLLGHADRLPLIDFHSISPKSSQIPLLFERIRNPEIMEPESPWTGWGWVTRDVIRQLNPQANEDDLYRFLCQHRPPQIGSIPVKSVLSVGSFEEILKANQWLLTEKDPGLFVSGHEVENGIWLSRNVSLDPTSLLIPPVYIGSDCQIGRGVRLGPNAVVGSGTVLDTRCMIKDSVIFPKSYVGEKLEIDHSLVDKNCLVNLHIGMAIEITDQFLLSGMADTMLSSWLFALLARAIALGGLIVFSPFLLLSWFITHIAEKGPAMAVVDCIRIPALSTDLMWRTYRLKRFVRRPMDAWIESKPQISVWTHFLFYFLPGLVAVLKGSMRLIGVDPRTKEEIQQLPSDWRELYLRSKAGLVSESFVYHGASASEDEIYASETFYTVHRTVKHDLRIAIYYFCQLLKIPFGPRKQGLNHPCNEINMAVEQADDLLVDHRLKGQDG